MYTASDIHIFLFTHNRAALLKEALQSLRSQTLQGFILTVLDNASTDNTQEVVASFKDINAQYVQTPKDLHLANLTYCQNMADTTFTVVFHDDDIMHPAYMENMIKVLNRFPSCSLVTPLFTYFNGDVPASVQTEQSVEQCYYFDNYKDYTITLWSEAFGCWSGSCCRTEYFKKISFLFKEYGKLHDCPMLIEIAKQGPAVVMANNKIFYVRLHQGRDSFNDTNAITMEQFVNWVKLFFDASGGGKTDNPLWFLYASRLEGVLGIQYNTYISPVIKNKMNFDDFKKYMSTQGLLSKDMTAFRRRYKNPFYFLKSVKFILKDKICNAKKYLVRL